MGVRADAGVVVRGSTMRRRPRTMPVRLRVVAAPPVGEVRKANAALDVGQAASAARPPLAAAL